MALPADDFLARKYGTLSPGRFQAMIQRNDDINFLIPLRNSFMVQDEAYGSMVSRRLSEIAHKQHGAKFSRAILAQLVPQVLSRDGYLAYNTELYGYLLRQSHYYLRAHVEYDTQHLQLMVLPIFMVDHRICLSNKFGLQALGDYFLFPKAETIDLYNESFLYAACRRHCECLSRPYLGAEILGFLDLRKHEPFNTKILIIVGIETRGLSTSDSTDLTVQNLDLFTEYILHRLTKPYMGN
jgi:hypothetical protein